MQSHFFYTASFTLLLILPIIGSQSWRTLAPLPSVRTEHSTIVIDGLIYALGGKTNTKVLSIVNVYDYKKDIWSDSTSMLVARYGFATAYGRTAAHLTDKRLYVFGGYLKTDSFTNHVEMFLPDSTISGFGSWVKAPNLPIKLAGASAVSVPHHPVDTDPTSGIIIAGGWFESNRASALIFFFNGFNYTELSEKMLFARADAGLVFVQLPDASWLYSLDGGADNAPAMNTVERMQFGKSGSWETVWDTNYARKLLASTTYDGKIYVIGGHTPEEYPVATIGCLNTSAFDMGWMEFKPALPQPLQGGSAVVIDKTIYIIGGATDYQTPIANNIALDL